MTRLDDLSRDVRNEVIERELELDPDDRGYDLQPEVNDRAYEAVDALCATSSGKEPSNKHIDIIEEYLGDDDRSGLEKYDAVGLFTEFYDGDITRTLKAMASGCVMHRVMDDLESIGISD